MVGRERFTTNYTVKTWLTHTHTHTCNTHTHVHFSRGTFAVVRKCTETSTNRQFAAKMIPCAFPAHHDLATREFEIHHQLAHPRILSLEDAFESKEHITLVLE